MKPTSRRMLYAIYISNRVLFGLPRVSELEWKSRRTAAGWLELRGSGLTDYDGLRRGAGGTMHQHSKTFITPLYLGEPNKEAI
ncbi:hypothetical protein NQZ68_032192 [Dissostichus eleginoides]|nr:hypothetical protein NQZ68_032192 [Dissostichus eleginoides]